MAPPVANSVTAKPIVPTPALTAPAANPAGTLSYISIFYFFSLYAYYIPAAVTKASPPAPTPAATPAPAPAPVVQAPAPEATPAPEQAAGASLDPNAPISIHPDSVVVQRYTVNNFGILGTYLQDPEYFEDQIKAKSIEDDYHYSADSLSLAFQQLCSEPSGEEIADFESYLVFNGSGLVPAYDVIAVLHAFRDALERTVSPPAAAVTTTSEHPSEYVSDEERYRIERILFYKAFAEAEDRITEVYHANPSSFDAVVKAAPANKKAFVGTELNECIVSHIPDVKQSEVTALESELATKKDKTGAIPSAAVCAALRHRLAVLAEYVKRQKRAELALERVRKIMEYREKAKLDPVTLAYKTSGKKFEADVTGSAASSSVLTGDELHSVLGKVVPDASTAVLDQLKTELVPKVLLQTGVYCVADV